MINMIMTGAAGVLTTAFIALCVYVHAKFKGTRKGHEATQKGVKALLRDRIIQIYNHYSVRKAMPIYARENVQGLLSEYKALGGNGALDGLVQRLMLLPTDNSYDPDFESRDVVE